MEGGPREVLSVCGWLVERCGAGRGSPGSSCRRCWGLLEAPGVLFLHCRDVLTPLGARRCAVQWQFLKGKCFFKLESPRRARGESCCLLVINEEREYSNLVGSSASK